MKQDKLLIISWNIYPWPTGSAIIVDNLMKQFTREEVVIIGEKYPKEFQVSWSTDYPKIYYLDPNITIFGRGQTHLRWIKFWTILKQIEQIIVNENVSKVLTVFPDDYYLIASFILCKKLNIKFYTWFHNTYSDNLGGYRRVIARYLEPKILALAKLNFVISDGLKDYFKSKYPKIGLQSLVHGFELPKVEKVNSFELNNPNQVKFLFTGSLNNSCLDATLRLCTRIIETQNYKLFIYSGNPFSDFENIGIKGDNVFYKGFIKIEELYQIISEFDIVLLPHGLDGDRSQVEFNTIFPTRTIPLLVSRKPILAHSTKDSFITNWLIEKNCAFIVESKELDQIDLAIKSILCNPSEVILKVNNAIDASNNFNVINTSDQIRRLLISEKF